MNVTDQVITNVDKAEERSHVDTPHYGGHYKILTPNMRPAGGKLGVNFTRLPPGRALCPFHYHHLEDEVFYILYGKWHLRHGDEVSEIGPGDCLSFPAGTKVPHQIVNTGDVDMEYLAIGNHDPNEVCVYPDSGKVMVRAESRVGTLAKTDYMHGEPSVPSLLEAKEE